MREWTVSSDLATKPIPSLAQKLMLRAAGVVAAFASKSTVLTFNKRIETKSAENDASFMLQIYLLCDTLGWEVETVALMMPISPAMMLEWINEVNDQRRMCAVIDFQVLLAEEILRDIAEPMLEECWN